MRVMIVEEDGLLALDLEQTLRMGEHTIIGPAPSADKARELATTDKPDLVLIDICLADGDTGPSLARELWERYEVPSLFLTANMQEGPDYTEAALGILAKPVSPKSLLRSINVVRRIMCDEPVTSKDVPDGLHLFVAL